jgi:hypothetical protein
VGKRFVAVARTKDPGSRGLDPGATGGNVLIKPAGLADAACLGVAEHDADIGKTTAVLCGGFTVPITAGGALTAGMPVGPGAGGKAVDVTAGGLKYGTALADAAADEDAIIKLI